MGHRDLQGQHRPVQRKRAPRSFGGADRHPGTRNRRDLHPLRRPQDRELAEEPASETRSGCRLPCLNAGTGPAACGPPGRPPLEPRRRTRLTGTIRRVDAVRPPWKHALSLSRVSTSAGGVLLAETGKGRGLETADPVVARQRIEEWATRQPIGFAAPDGVSRRLLGFMAVCPSGGRRARVRLDQHATVGGELGHRVRCALYAALSGQLAGDGVLVHEADVLAGDEGAVTSFARLGFGIDQVKGFRPAAPAAWDRVRRALRKTFPGLSSSRKRYWSSRGAADVAATGPGVSAMVERGYRRAIEDGRRVSPAGSRGDTGRGCRLDAGRPRQPVHRRGHDRPCRGTQRFRSTGSVRLLNAVTDWSAGLGFARCGAGWTSANPVSDQFWRSRGLVPQAYRMSRVIDRRPLAVPQIRPGRSERDGSPP